MDEIQFKLRLPVELKTRLEAEAALGNRSLSAEITKRLEESFVEADRIAVQDEANRRLADHVRERTESLIKTLEMLQSSFDRVQARKDVLERLLDKSQLSSK